MPRCAIPYFSALDTLLMRSTNVWYLLTYYSVLQFLDHWRSPHWWKGNDTLWLREYTLKSGNNNQGCRGYGDSHGDSYGYGYGMGMGTVMNPHRFCGNSVGIFECEIKWKRVIYDCDKCRGCVSICIGGRSFLWRKWQCITDKTVAIV